MSNSFYLILNMVHTMAAESIKQKEISESFRKKMNKQFKTGFSNYLPKIKKHSITINGRVVPTGTIVIRPLKFKAATDLLNEYHYGVAIGTDYKGFQYIIEMTDGDHVNIKTKAEFIKPYNERQLDYHYIPDKKFTPEILYKKARRFEDSVYSILNLNCIDFSRYLIFDKEPERRADAFNSSLVEIGNDLNKLDEIMINSSIPPEQKKFYQRNIEKRNVNNKIIQNSIKAPKSDLILNKKAL